MRRYSFQWLVGFVGLSVLGLAFLPRLAVQLAPSEKGRTLTVQFRWPGAAPVVVERQVTARLEGLFATVSGLQKIESVSGYQYGSVKLTVDRRVAVDDVRFELAALVRQIHPGLPAGVDYPTITVYAPGGQEGPKPLLSFQLSGPSSPATLLRFADEQLKPRLAAVAQVGEVAVFGGAPEEWYLTYRLAELKALRLTEEELSQALTRYFRREALGLIHSAEGRRRRVMVQPPTLGRGGESVFAAIPVAYRGGRTIFLTDVVRVSHEEPPPASYFRINGKSAVNLVVSAAAGANQLAVAGRVRQGLREQGLPPGYRLDVDYDATVFIRENLNSLALQTGVAVLILLAFVALTTRSTAYVALIILSSLVTLLLTVLLFVLLGVELHLYSLAALTTSLGILIDNAIVMIEHYRRHRDLGAFPALLGATLATCCGLVVIWFLPEENRQALEDFAVVMALTLGVSLLVAVAFIPALLEHRKWIAAPSRSRRRLRPLVFLNRLYGRLITVLRRWRRSAFAGMVLAFGLPVFWLPTRLPADHWPAGLYNRLLGGAWYLETVKPWVNKCLGGTLRLFVHYVYEGSSAAILEQTVLYVVAELPNHSTPEQLNEVLRRFETEFGRYREVDRYITEVHNGREGSVTVYFKEAYEKGGFPHLLRSRAIALSADMGGVDWDIYGVGQGFSQQAEENGTPTFNLALYGYNYRQLEEQALRLKDRLEKHPRVQEVNINRLPGLFQRKSVYEYTLRPDAAQLALLGVTPEQVEARLRDLSARPQPDHYQFIGDDYETINLLPEESRTFDVWQLMHTPFYPGDQMVKTADFGRVSRQKVVPEIRREDQQYRRVISFDYSGSYHFGEKFLTETLTGFKPALPVGYTAKALNRDWFGEDKGKPYELLALIALLIYLITAVIFENLRQPLALLGLIPLSYIGVFLASYWADVNFDQGGYAGLILLTGNVVCAGIFIVTEMNRLGKRYPGLSPEKRYLKAFRRKIQPILLTVLSTVVGMLPFLLVEQQPFWYAFGITTIGGLTASLPALGLYLPLFLLKKEFSK